MFKQQSASPAGNKVGSVIVMVKSQSDNDGLLHESSVGAFDMLRITVISLSPLCKIYGSCTC